MYHIGAGVGPDAANEPVGATSGKTAKESGGCRSSAAGGQGTGSANVGRCRNGQASRAGNGKGSQAAGRCIGQAAWGAETYAGAGPGQNTIDAGKTVKPPGRAGKTIADAQHAAIPGRRTPN